MTAAPVRSISYLLFRERLFDAALSVYDTFISAYVGGDARRVKKLAGFLESSRARVCRVTQELLHLRSTFSSGIASGENQVSSAPAPPRPPPSWPPYTPVP